MARLDTHQLSAIAEAIAGTLSRPLELELPAVSVEKPADVMTALALGGGDVATFSVATLFGGDVRVAVWSVGS